MVQAGVNSVAPVVEAVVDSIAAIIEPIIDAISTIVEPLIDAVAASIQARIDSIAPLVEALRRRNIVCPNGAARQRESGGNDRRHGKFPKLPFIHDHSPYSITNQSFCPFNGLARNRLTAVEQKPALCCIGREPADLASCLPGFALEI